MFKLLDSKGLNSQVIDYSQKNNILVSSVGNTIAMKYINNKPNDEIEVYLKEHKNKILALKFSPCENFLISIDNSVYPEYIIWKIGNEITPIYKDNINIPNTSENNTKFSRFNTNKNNNVISILHCYFATTVTFSGSQHVWQCLPCPKSIKTYVLKIFKNICPKSIF